MSPHSVCEKCATDGEQELCWHDKGLDIKQNKKMEDIDIYLSKNNWRLKMEPINKKADMG